MRSDKSQTSASSRQKLIAGGLVIVVIIILWQVIGLFRGGSSSTTTPTPAATVSAGAPGAANMPSNPTQSKPEPMQLVKVEPATTPREAELMRLQQETQAKYIAALNDLQMLKVSREIAETNQAIMVAKLATVTAERNIVNMLIPQQQVSPADYARGLVTAGNLPAGIPPTTTTTQSVATITQVNYSVISVSLLQYRWSAVLGYQGSLYNVHVGDVLPPDGSMVVSISRSGVVLEKSGVRKKVSLVPVI